jgi:hypothetical protein
LAVFAVVPGGGVDVPAEAVGVEGAGVGAACGVGVCDGGFGELACGEICDLDVEVKWRCPLEEFYAGGDGCVLKAVVMTAEELLERYAAGERDFRGITLYEANLIRADLRSADFSNADLSGSYLIAANLKNCIFQRTCLEGVDLTSSLLVKADLTKRELD